MVKYKFTPKKCDNKSCLVMIMLRMDLVLCLDYFIIKIKKIC